MRIDIRSNTKRSIGFGLIYKIGATIAPFFVQMVFIRKLGIEYVGIRGLYSSLLTVFSLAELGFGSAIVFSMYKPIAEENKEEICALLNLYRRAYRIIGCIILLFSIAALPFLPVLIKGSAPEDINIYLVFILFAVQTVLSYWMFAYKSSILQAYQRNDVISIIGLIITLGTSVVQIGALLLFRNFYVYLLIAIVSVIINNIATSAIVDRMYPDIVCRGEVSAAQKADIKKRVYGVFIGKICMTTRNTFDSIFISAFIGLVQAGIYANYFHVLTALNGFMSIITSSLLAGVGNRIVLETEAKNYDDMMRINKVYLVIGGWMAACMLCLYQPFMMIWMGKENLFPERIMALFPIYFYIMKMGDVRGIYSDAAGLFWENRRRTIAEAIANIVLNYLFVKLFGVFGVLLATIITLFFIGFLGSTQVIFKHYYKSGKKEYLLNEGKYLIYAVFISVVTYFVCGIIVTENIILALLGRTLICITVAPALYWIILRQSKDFYDVRDWLYRMIR